MLAAHNWAEAASFRAGSKFKVLNELNENEAKKHDWIAIMWLMAGISIAVVYVALGIVTLMGARKMKNYESFGFALTSCILAIVAGFCFLPFGVPNLAIGI